MLADVNDDGLLDIVYGNWVGPHRLLVQTCDGTFENYATAAMAVPSRVRMSSRVESIVMHSYQGRHHI